MLTAEQVQVTSTSVTLPDGRPLAVLELSAFAHSHIDSAVSYGVACQLRVKRAVGDSLVMCLRPDGTNAGKFGILLAEALDVAYHDASRVVAADPYDANGEPLTCDGTDLRMFWADGRSPT